MAMAMAYDTICNDNGITHEHNTYQIIDAVLRVLLITNQSQANEFFGQDVNRVYEWVNDINCLWFASFRPTEFF